MEKVLLCTSSFENGLGGVPAYARDLVDAFKNDYEIIVATGSKNVTNPPCKVVFIDDKDISFANAKKLINLVEEESPDIVINSSFLLLSLMAPYLPDNIKIITVSHFVNGYYARVAGYNAAYVDSIIALSSFGSDHIRKRFHVKEHGKMETVYNFMAPLNDGPNYEKSQREVINIVYPGGSNRKKSADIFLKAILRLLKTNLTFRLYWVGGVGIPGGNWPFTILKSIKQILPDDKRIAHLGFVQRDKAQEIFKDANVFVLPSRGEGFPISLIEAMRGRCIPIISDARHGALDVIEDGKNGFISKQSDYLDLYEKLEYIIKNHCNMGKLYDESYKTYANELKQSLWVERMQHILEKNKNHKQRKAFSPIMFFKMQLCTKLYLFYFFVLKEKIRDNILTMLVYRKIYLNRKRY